MKGFGQPGPDSLIKDARWHIYDFHLLRGEFVLLPMAEADYRASLFLDSRIRVTDNRRFSAKLNDTLRVFLTGNTTPLAPSFIFHTGHCGSTLLTRALDGSNTVLPLREPRTLNTLSGLKHELGQPVCIISKREFNAIKTALLQSLARVFQAGQRPLVKVTSTCNNLIQPVLAGAEQARALLLHQTLASHLAGRLDSKAGRLDLVVQARERMLDWMSIRGTPKLFNARLRPEQMAVLSWLTSMYYLTEAEQVHPDRVCRIDFDDFLETPVEHLLAAVQFLGLDIPEEELRSRYEVVSGQYSKSPDRDYSAQERRDSLQQARTKHAKVIENAMQWAVRLIHQVPALKPVEPHLG